MAQLLGTGATPVPEFCAGAAIAGQADAGQQMLQGLGAKLRTLQQPMQRLKAQTFEPLHRRAAQLPLKRQLQTSRRQRQLAGQIRNAQRLMQMGLHPGLGLRHDRGAAAGWRLIVQRWTLRRLPGEQGFQKMLRLFFGRPGPPGAGAAQQGDEPQGLVDHGAGLRTGADQHRRRGAGHGSRTEAHGDETFRGHQQRHAPQPGAALAKQMQARAAEHGHARLGENLLAIHRFPHPAAEWQPQHGMARRLMPIQPGTAGPLDRHHADVADVADLQMGLEAERGLLVAAVEQLAAVISQEGAHRRLPMVEVTRAQDGLERIRRGGLQIQGGGGRGQTAQR